tara:strand:- start:579 stop:1730 length:1152 start_codon:yes stop_codon:yes gene_type:complete
MEYKKFEDSNIIIEYSECYNTELNINLELLRCDYYNIITDMLINLIDKYYSRKIFCKKKPFRRTITNILSNHIFSQYRKNNNTDDIFIPKLTDTDLLENIFKDYLNKDYSKEKIIQFFNEFNLEYLYIYNTFIAKKKIIKNNKINIMKKKVFIKDSEFIKLCPYKIYNKKYEVILYSERFTFLEKLYNSKNYTNAFNDIIYCILLRYFTLGSNNNQLAVSPSKMNMFKDKYNLSFESFASSINFISDYFCSVYPDLEKYFGSFGNFFSVKFIKGCFNFNPPFQEDIINIGIKKIFFHLENSNEDLTFIVTIPVWDTEGKKLFGIEDTFSDLPIINEIKSNKFLKSIQAVSKENFNYHDYIFNLVKNVTIQNTYLIILSNTTLY